MWRLVEGQSIETRFSKIPLDSNSVMLCPAKPRSRRRQPLPEKPYCSTPTRTNNAENSDDYWKAATQQMKQKIRTLKDQTESMETEIQDHERLKNEYKRRFKNLENSLNDTKPYRENIPKCQRNLPHVPHGDRNQQLHRLTGQGIIPQIKCPAQEQLANQRDELQGRLYKLESQRQIFIQEINDKLAEVEKSKHDLLNKVMVLESKIGCNAAIERQNNELLKEIQNKEKENMALVQKVQNLQTKNQRLLGETKDLRSDLETIRAKNKFKMERKISSVEDELKKERNLSNRFKMQVMALEKIVNEMEISAENEAQLMHSQLNNTIHNMYCMKQMNMELVEKYRNLEKYVNELQGINRQLQKKQDRTIIDMSLIISDMQQELEDIKSKISVQTVPQHDIDVTLDDYGMLDDTRNKIPQNISKGAEIVDSKATDSTNLTSTVKPEMAKIQDSLQETDKKNDMKEDLQDTKKDKVMQKTTAEKPPITESDIDRQGIEMIKPQDNSEEATSQQKNEGNKELDSSTENNNQDASKTKAQTVKSQDDKERSSISSKEQEQSEENKTETKANNLNEVSKNGEISQDSTVDESQSISEEAGPQPLEIDIGTDDNDEDTSEIKPQTVESQNNKDNSSISSKEQKETAENKTETEDDNLNQDSEKGEIFQDLAVDKSQEAGPQQENEDNDKEINNEIQNNEQDPSEDKSQSVGYDKDGNESEDDKEKLNAPFIEQEQSMDNDNKLKTDSTDNIKEDPASSSPQQLEDNDKQLENNDQQLDSEAANNNKIERTSITETQEFENQQDTEINNDDKKSISSEVKLQDDEKYEEVDEVVTFTDVQQLEANVTPEVVNGKDDQTTEDKREIDRKGSGMSDSDVYLDTENEAQDLGKEDNAQDDDDKGIEPPFSKSTADSSNETANGNEEEIQTLEIVPVDSVSSVDTSLENEAQDLGKEHNSKDDDKKDIEPPFSKIIADSSNKTANGNEKEIETLGIVKVYSVSSIDTLLENEKRPRKIKFSDSPIETKPKDNIVSPQDNAVNEKFLKQDEEPKSCLCKHGCLTSLPHPELPNDVNLASDKQNDQDIDKQCICYTFKCSTDANGHKRTSLSQDSSKNDSNKPEVLKTELLNGNNNPAYEQQDVNLIEKTPAAGNEKEPSSEGVKSSSENTPQQGLQNTSTQMKEATCSCSKKYKLTSPETVMTNYCKCPDKNISKQNGSKFNSTSAKPVNEIRKRNLNSSEVVKQTNLSERIQNYLNPQDAKSKTVNILFLKSGNENNPSCKCLALMDLSSIPTENNLEFVNKEKMMATSPKYPSNYTYDQENTDNMSNSSYQYIDERKCSCPTQESNKQQSLSTTGNAIKITETSEDCPCLMSAVIDTVLRLTESLAILQNKCRTKDRMIQSLADELNTRSVSGVFNNLLTNLSMDESEFPGLPRDFDRVGLCEYLKKPAGYVGRLQYSQRPCIPPCPTKDQNPNFSTYPDNGMLFPCKGSCSKKGGTEKFPQMFDLNPPCDDPCKAPCSESRRPEDLKTFKRPCDAECESTCSQTVLPKSAQNGNLNSPVQPCDEPCKAPCKKIPRKDKQYKKKDDAVLSSYLPCTAPCAKLPIRNGFKDTRISKGKPLPSSMVYPNIYKRGSSKTGYKPANNAICSSDKCKAAKAKIIPSNGICKSPCSKSTKRAKEISSKSSSPPHEDPYDAPCRNNSRNTNITKTGISFPPCDADCLSSCTERETTRIDNPFSDCIPSYDPPTGDHMPRPGDGDMVATKDKNLASIISDSNKKEDFDDLSSSSGLCQAPCAQKELPPDTNVPPPSDLEVIHLTSIDAVLLSWRPPSVDGLHGYEVYMDGSLMKKVTRHRTTALLRGIDCSCEMSIKVYTITRTARSFEAATYP